MAKITSTKLPIHYGLPPSKQANEPPQARSTASSGISCHDEVASEQGSDASQPSQALRSIESQCFAITDMSQRPAAKNTICADCAYRMSLDEVKQCRVFFGGEKAVMDSQECVICSWKTGNPAAFTWPYLNFMTENPTIFHAVDYFKQILRVAGFEELTAREDWSARLRPGGKYYVTRNGSTLAAFTIGGAYRPGNGVAIVAGHIDALTAKLKPVSNKPDRAGYVQLGVAPYAGALNETWWDRDLGIGGRVVVRDPETGWTTTRLVKLDWPIAKIPTLAPHFGVSMTGQGNKETQLVPVIGLDSGSKTGSMAEQARTVEPALGPAGSFIASQPPKLVKLIAAELGVKSYASIVNWELELFDTQPATVFGLDKEMISAGRIDDKICSWAALVALLRARDNDSSGVVRLVALFDDEEIGSLLRQGAKSNFLPLTVERIVEALSPPIVGSFGPGVIGRTYASSFLISSDVTHAIHPNFVANYLDDHAPKLNVGVAITHDSNGHMTTDSVSTAQLQRVAELSGSTLQRFMIRNDSRSGGTIGPSLSSAMGVKSADAGIPQLSMHSIRASTGALDPGLGVRFFQGFLENWETVDAEWQ
ncbi:aspartyl aminopeptidase [Grosmannia clavigera kw1407]|uniref:Aspartyl aminopeptidase n=1 Tax=Grosmannia clavigera (strain kw1407 / UAMH 11150) TaxID=655863 RepID=F0XNX0_GROCL|nr:aspartyl aminopeptidase [Grosmannia clavigera kw1407]EFX00447.1 aspartyl aminopeptidase [Grosmannia clavigera kw1407]